MSDRVITTSEWWERARAGNAMPIRDGHPQAGYYAVKRRGLMVPARLWKQDGRWHCLIGGRPADAVREWPYLAKRPIAADTYGHLMKTLRPADRRNRRAVDDLPPPF